METRKKKNTFNILMVVLIAVIAFCGIMAVGMIKGWFGGADSDSDIMSGKVSGVANIERDGIGYSLKENVALEDNDILETKNGSEGEMIINKDNILTLNQNTELQIVSSGKDDVNLTLNEGEFFADVPKAGDSFQVAFGENTAYVKGTVFSVSVQHGSAALNVYEGSVRVDAEDGSSADVKAGEYISIAHSGEGELTAEVKKLKAASLSDFLIEKAKTCDSSAKLCFTGKELQKIQEDRTAEKQETEKAAQQSSETIAGGTSSNKSNAAGSDGNVKTCTVTIRCDTILNNMADLKPGKDRYVPSNGVILSASTVEFEDGETVFDVLKRVCSHTGIHLEYSWTPMYDSYYIEGINHLYEFDCGNQSGWMYKVNGWFPNYGCSSYNLKDGDNIVWTYTCKGLGADVGGGM